MDNIPVGGGNQKQGQMDDEFATNNNNDDIESNETLEQRLLDK